jgi:hypothetical protein
MTPVARRRAIGAVAVAVAAIAVVVVIVIVGGSPGPPKPPAAGVATPDRRDVFAYDPAHAARFTARATAGNAHVLFAKSPGGAILTAARVAAYRGAIDRAVAGTGIDPNQLEGLVYVESAGRPTAIAGSDPADAAGLTQILAATGQSLLGMHIDLARSRKLTSEIDAVATGARRGNLKQLIAQRAAADARFDPGRALAATVRYLQDAERRFGRQDLAFESYHMGIGNLHSVLADYDGGRAATPPARVVPYVQLYFDSTPERHAAAFRLLAGFGDDSSLYWWRILGAEQVMHLYRTDRAELRHLTSLQLADDAGSSVLHPPGHPPRYADRAALGAAYRSRALVPLPRNAAALGLAYDRSPQGPLYRGLAPAALRALLVIGGTVRSLSGTGPLHVSSTVADARSALGMSDPLATTGYTLRIDRRYRDGAQAAAFQAVLDRLQSLNLIAWAAEGSEIAITVAPDAGSWRA